jgi:TRAP-type C4-dicarboxylate transport system permease small subunit
LSRLQSILAALEKTGRAAEDTVLVIILGGMIFLAAGQILLRNLFDIGFYWGDELLRLLVLWIAVAGAVAASRTDKHISIAILDRFLPEKSNTIARFFVNAFTAGICGLVTWYSISFVRTSFEYEDVLLGGVPAWILQLVLPVGFGLITYRYALFCIRTLLSLFRREPAA